MATEAKKTVTAVPATPTRRKISTEQLDLAKQKSGFSLQGVYRGIVEGAPFASVDKQTGEVTQKTLKFAIFQRLDSEERFRVIADKGLQTGILEAQVKEGDAIEIVKLEKNQISKGRTMNQYDIFSLS